MCDRKAAAGDERAAALMDQISELAKEAGRIILEGAGHAKSRRSKEGHANFVTEYDARVQRFLIGHLQELLPEAHFVGEEDGAAVFLPEYEDGLTFVIDPIDGTSNFMKGYPPSVTSIGLLKDGKPWIGVIYNPFTDQLFTGLMGVGAWENGVPIHTSGDAMADSLIMMGTTPYYYDELARQTFDLAYEYLARCIDLRRSGSAAWDMCMVASGRIGMYFELRIHLWDYAAAACILEAAGGRVTDEEGRPLSYRDRSAVFAVSVGIAKEDYLPTRHKIKMASVIAADT